MVELKSKNGTKYEFEAFESLDVFSKIIKGNEENSVFKGEYLESKTLGEEDFRGTSSFEEAMDLFTNGWSFQAEKLEKLLKLANNKFSEKKVIKSEYNVAGYQASVPRYLQGIPQNMVCQKRIPQKKKVITINKDACYPMHFSKEEIEAQSILIFQLIQKIEAQGIKVALNLIYGTRDKGNEQRIIVKIKLKSASERLNISKLAFPLIHPSMQRRLFLRYTEVCSFLKAKKFTSGYGRPLENEELRELFPDEILLPKNIKNIDGLLEEAMK